MTYRLNRPGAPEVLGCELCCRIDVVRGSIILIFGFGRRDVADGLQQSTMVEPVDPFERVVLDSVGVEAAPRFAPVDHLSRVGASDKTGAVQ